MKEFTKWDLHKVGVIYTSQFIRNSQSKHVGSVFMPSAKGVAQRPGRCAGWWVREGDECEGWGR